MPPWECLLPPIRPPCSILAAFNVSNVIDNFSFCCGGDAADVGDVIVGRTTGGEHSSTENGYMSGGYTGSHQNVIDKHNFATSGNATDVGDLTTSSSYSNGVSYLTHGYTFGGYTGSNIDIIERFSFSSGTQNGADVGDLATAKRLVAGSQY